MKKKLCIVAMMAALMLWGCTPDEKKAEPPAPETMSAAEQVKDKAVEVTKEVVEATKAAEEVAEEKVVEATTAVVEATKAVDEAVEEKIEKRVEQQAAVVAQEKAVETAEKMEEKAASVVEKSGQPVTTTVESVVIDNNKGKVVLLHKRHAEAYGCAACHGDQKPGPFTLGKDKAHALCQGCHKEKKAGPTSCTKCHQKKDKAVEGC
jgi:uncharacterized lipoprotein NlpE involved in copper resistance